MGNSEANGGVTPFGVENTAGGAETSLDAMNVFLQDAALPLIAALVVAFFLIYQFGRWFVAQRAMQAEPLRTGPASGGPGAADEDERPASRAHRPWRVEQ